MGFPERPAETDIEFLKRLNMEFREDVHDLIFLTGKQTEALNALGKNVQWVIDNVQGIFQMFSNPNVINEMMTSAMGMMSGKESQDGGE